MKKKIVAASISIIVFCCWTIQQKNEIKRAEWLVGTWENKTKKGSIYETWVKGSDSELLGKSYMLNNKDTVVFETVKLVQEKNNLFYIPTVKDQNKSLPVRFTLIKSSDKLLVFENPKHDFPQKISYTKINIDSLIAEISGLVKGKARKQTFPMKRVK
jgi:hypothetical protein